MELDAIFDRLTGIFRDVFDDDGLVLKPEIAAADIPDWDSLNHIRLVLSAEKAFAIKFSAWEIGKLKNVGEFAELIQAGLSKPAARAVDWGTLSVGTRAKFDFVVTAEDMRNFATLSGDLNPLHTDDAFARAKGYRGAVVYGGLIVAKLSKLIGMDLPGRDAVWTRIELQFQNPLYVYATAQIEAQIESLSEATRAIGLAVEVRSGQTLVAKGRAEVLNVAQ